MSEYTYQQTWQQVDDRLTEELIQFWQQHKAIDNAEAARQRASQVVYVARNSADEIIAVCTAMLESNTRLGIPLYYYRSFVAPEYRHTQISYRLVRHSQSALTLYINQQDNPESKGILMELENQKLGENFRWLIWPKVNFVYVGKSARGLDLRVYYFPGARLD